MSTLNKYINITSKKNDGSLECNSTPGKSIEEKREDTPEVLENPFRRSSAVARSPPASTTVEKPKEVKEPPCSSMDKLGEKIKKLVEFVKGRTNIHKEIVSMSREIQALFMQVSSNGGRPAEVSNVLAKDKEVQTDAWPRLGSTATPAKKRGPKTQSPKGSMPKKKKDTCLKEVAKNGPEATPLTASVSVEHPDPGATEPKWQMVRSKTRRRRKPARSTRPARPDALLIKTCGDTSYADILRQVKTDPKLNVLGENVRNIRKTEKGELLLELNRPAHQNTAVFRKSIEETLGTVAEVRALTQEAMLEIKDLDEVTTKEDVYDAIKRMSDKFEMVQQSAVKTIRRAYGGTQTATIGLSPALANILLQEGKIRIGWVLCRVREKIVPRRCFKCLNFGHTAVRCTSLNDFSKSCLRCGESGHKIKTCTNSPNCLLCRDRDSNPNHVTGSVICPHYRRAIQTSKAR